MSKGRGFEGVGDPKRIDRRRADEVSERAIRRGENGDVKVSACSNKAA